ncbi:MAG TPA: glycosyltransferase family 2 protein [Opitutaceae bacterium]|jgi:GT2 family glycosyltransferase
MKESPLIRARRQIRALAGIPATRGWEKEVTVIVKTFERPACVAQCLASVRRHYPSLAVLVCDDGREPLFGEGEEPSPGILWTTLPYEAGHTLGAGRNHLVDRVRTPFFFLADDDHVLGPHTRIDVLHAALGRHSLDICGGSQGKGDYSFAVFEEGDGVVRQVFNVYHEELEPGIVRCDRVPNSFLAGTEAVRRVRWEERVYAAEHTDFFLRATRAGLRTALVGYVYVDHDRSCEERSGLLGKLLHRWLPHSDRSYARQRGGAGQGRSPRELEEEFVLKKNGVRAIIHVGNRGLRRGLEARLGDPYYGRPPTPGAIPPIA